MEQGEELKEARGYTCLILIRQEGTEGESPGILREAGSGTALEPHRTQGSHARSAGWGPESFALGRPCTHAVGGQVQLVVKGGGALTRVAPQIFIRLDISSFESQNVLTDKSRPSSWAVGLQFVTKFSPICADSHAFQFGRKTTKKIVSMTEKCPKNRNRGLMTAIAVISR